MDYKKLIMKNLNAILCGLSLIFFFCPFLVATAKAMGQKNTEDWSGYEILFGEASIWGFLVIIGIIAVLVFDYVKQLDAFKKLGSLIASGVTVLGLVISVLVADPDKIRDAKEFADKLNIDFTIGGGVGFWIPLIFAVVMLAVALIKYLNLKGNPVFDLINGDAE